jgi:electron transport complex protein RnfD
MNQTLTEPATIRPGITDHDPDSNRSIILALIPAMIMSMIFFRHNSLTMMLAAVVTCLLTDWAAQKFLLKVTVAKWDGKAAVTGILLAFCVPPGLPLWLMVIGSVIAIAIYRIPLGRYGSNRISPALAASLFLLILFPEQMTRWTATITESDAFTGATPLEILDRGIHGGKTVTQIMTENAIPSYFDMFWGDMSGSLGEISAMAILIGGIYLLMKKTITWHIPAAVIVSMFLLEGVLWIAVPGRFADPVFHMVTGGAMLGAVFLATCQSPVPSTAKGRLLFGAGIGVITILLRNFGPYPEGIGIAILIMNLLTPWINAKTPVLQGN